MKNNSFDMTEWGPATVLVVLITLIVVVVGGVYMIVTDNLSFDQYIQNIIVLAGAIGVLSIGRGIHKGLAQQGTAPPPMINVTPPMANVTPPVTMSAEPLSSPDPAPTPKKGKYRT